MFFWDPFFHKQGSLNYGKRQSCFALCEKFFDWRDEKNWKQVNLNPRSQTFFLSYKQIGFQTNRHLQFFFSTPLIDEKSRKKRTLSTTFYWVTNNLLVRFSSIRCSLVRVFHVCSLFMSYSIFKQEFLISSRSIPSSHACLIDENLS